MDITVSVNSSYDICMYACTDITLHNITAKHYSTWICSTAINLGPVVQSIVYLTSSLVVKIFTVLVRIILNSQVFSLKKKVSSFFFCHI